jgi:phosphohistidine phosphatase SixA
MVLMRQFRVFVRLGLVFILSIQAQTVGAEGRHILLEAITEIDADVVFMRHALAPGFGDPDNFSLTECNTQRNLDQVGRSQAIEIGMKIKESGLSFIEVLSSEWCRCKETAQLLDIGQWETFSGLNSFFQDYADRVETLQKLDGKLSDLKTGVTFMVTHQVVIRAVTGVSVGSGELVAYNSSTELIKTFRLD